MKLLIVDDQRVIVDGLQNQIDWTSIGISEVFGAYSAAGARKILLEQNIDILLCDVEMPIEDGLSLISWIREQGMPVCCIVLTSHAEFAYAQKSVGLGAFDYILQPAPYAKIRSVVQRAVEQTDAQQQRQIPYGKVMDKLREAITMLQTEPAPAFKPKAPPQPPCTVQRSADTPFLEDGGDNEIDVVEQVRQYVDRHMEEEIQRGDLAATVFLSPDYLNRLIKKQTGHTLKGFVIQRKMERAHYLLAATRLPVHIIASRVGYENVSHFCYTFKKIIGQTPSDIRNSMLGKDANETS